MLQAVELINASGRPVVAIDIPTGIDADTGEVMGSAVKADLTVTMALLKRGLVLYPGAGMRERSGSLISESRPRSLKKKRSTYGFLNSGSRLGILGRRETVMRTKGIFGHLLVVAGSPGKAGAAVMTAKRRAQGRSRAGERGNAERSCSDHPAAGLRSHVHPLGGKH